jgi:transposase
MKNVPFGAHVLHTDTTNFSLHGKYKNLDPELNTIEITYGHPKDMRWDLKRFVLSMVCNQDGLKMNDKVYHIVDSAIYSDDNITELGEYTLWITRVPATITEVKDLLNTDIELKSCTDIRYSYYETTSSYGDIEQKWILIQSEEMNKFVRNQVKKPIQNPTIRWVFFLFRRITEYTINLGEAVKRDVANMTDKLWNILGLMGKKCEKYYV